MTNIVEVMPCWGSIKKKSFLQNCRKLIGRFVGAGGFEPPTSPTRTVRASRAALRPDNDGIILHVVKGSKVSRKDEAQVLKTRAAADAFCLLIGSMKQKRLPMPTLLSTQI